MASECRTLNTQWTHVQWTHVQWTHVRSGHMCSGPLCAVDTCMMWTPVCSGHLCAVDPCVGWTHVCSGPMCAVDPCVQWTHVCSGPMRTAGGMRAPWNHRASMQPQLGFSLNVILHREHRCGSRFSTTFKGVHQCVEGWCVIALPTLYVSPSSRLGMSAVVTIRRDPKWLICTSW